MFHVKHHLIINVDTTWTQCGHNLDNLDTMWTTWTRFWTQPGQLGHDSGQSYFKKILFHVKHLLNDIVYFNNVSRETL